MNARFLGADHGTGRLLFTFWLQSPSLGIGAGPSVVQIFPALPAGLGAAHEASWQALE